jgi:lanosterol synthase
MSFSELDIPESPAVPFTDYSRWRLVVDEDGRHTFTYLKTNEECEKWPQSALDKYWLGLPTVGFSLLSILLLVFIIPQKLPALSVPKTPLDSARNGYEFYKHLQAHDGHWPGEYGGPLFLVPGFVIGSYVTGMPFRQEERLEIIRYLMNTVAKDGGWGMCAFLLPISSVLPDH